MKCNWCIVLIGKAGGAALFCWLAIATHAGTALTIPTGILPAGVIWTNQVGVVGGIPNVTTIYTNLNPGGYAVDHDNIQNALQSCPSNQVVYLNAGTYIVNGLVDFGRPYSPNGGVVLRGAGMGQTKLIFTNYAYFLICGTANFYNTPDASFATNWTAGYSQGSTNISIQSVLNAQGRPVVAGDLLFLTQEIDPNLVNPTGNEGALGSDVVLTDLYGQNCYQQQIVHVTSISGTNLTIWPPVYMTNIQSSLNPQAFWTGDAGVGIPLQKQMCGIENLTIDDGSCNNFVISFNHAYNCWVRNVEVTNSGVASVGFIRSAHCAVTGGYFHDCYSGGAITTYGINPNGSSDILIENNIFYKITSPVMFGGGNSGCVVAYNLCTNMIYGVAPGNMMASFGLHGCHNSMNLFEGNVGTEFEADYVWGSSSHTMVFRNCFSGYETNLNNTVGFNMLYQIAATVQATNRYTSFVGNILGSPTWTTLYESSPVATPGANFGRVAYSLGWFDGNDANKPDSQTVATLWRNGNFDYASNSITWDGSGAVTLPTSLYLPSQPSWWSNSVPFPPIGSDLTPMVSAIPAQLRFAAMTGIALGGGNNQTPVAVASATPANGPAPLNVTFSSAGSTDPEGATLVYNWDFGDGTPSSAANPVHTYSSAGNYVVKLTVSDGVNAATVSNITVVATGLVAAFGFDDTNASTVMDSATRRSDGTIINATHVWGKYGSAILFNGTNSVVSVTNLMVSALSSNMTIEAWINPTIVANIWMPVIGKSLNGSQFRYVLQGVTPQNGAPSVFMAPSSNNLYCPAILPTNTWSHLAATYDGTTLRLYLNGSLAASQALSGVPTASNEPLTIGSDGLLQSFWNGAIDEVRIYNRALSAAEIQADMNTPVVPNTLGPPQILRVVSP